MSRAKAPRVGLSFRDAVNPSLEAAGKTSMFCTPRNDSPTLGAFAGYAVPFMNIARPAQVDELTVSCSTSIPRSVSPVQ